MAINVIFAVIGIQKGGAFLSSVFQPTVPVLASLLCLIAGLERMDAFKATGIALTVGGAAIVVVFSRETGDDAKDTTLGIIFDALQCVGIAAYLVLQKPLLSVYPSGTVTAVGHSCAAIVTLIALIVFAAEGHGSISAWSLGSIDDDGNVNEEWYLPWAALAYATLVATVVNYVLISWANKYSSPTLVSLYMAVQPFSTALLSVAAGISHFHYLSIIGGAVIISGLFVTLRSPYGGVDKSSIDADERAGIRRMEDKLTTMLLPPEGDIYP